MWLSLRFCYGTGLARVASPASCIEAVLVGWVSQGNIQWGAWTGLNWRRVAKAQCCGTVADHEMASCGYGALAAYPCAAFHFRQGLRLSTVAKVAAGHGSMRAGRDGRALIWADCSVVQDWITCCRLADVDDRCGPMAGPAWAERQTDTNSPGVTVDHAAIRRAGSH